MTVPACAVDGGGDLVTQQLGYLSACLDPITTAALDELGVRPGWHCLEVAAGSGSIATWLADRVGPEGRVTALERYPQAIEPRRNLSVVRRDVVADPLPPRAYDLVHARLMLLQVPEREEVVEQMVQALRPGGWLVLDEFDCTYLPVHAPDPIALRLFRRVNNALLALVAARGGDVAWGARVYGAFIRAGLAEVSASSRANVWRGGEPGCLLHRTSTQQLEPQLLAAGLTVAELEAFRELMLDRRFAVNSYLTVTVRGRRPTPAG